MTVHTVWVPKGWTAAETLNAIDAGIKIPQGRGGRWVNYDDEIRDVLRPRVGVMIVVGVVLFEVAVLLLVAMLLGWI